MQTWPRKTNQALEIEAPYIKYIYIYTLRIDFMCKSFNEDFHNSACASPCKYTYNIKILHRNALVKEPKGSAWTQLFMNDEYTHANSCGQMMGKSSFKENQWFTLFHYEKYEKYEKKNLTT